MTKKAQGNSRDALIQTPPPFSTISRQVLYHIHRWFLKLGHILNQSLPHKGKTVVLYLNLLKDMRLH